MNPIKKIPLPLFKHFKEFQPMTNPLSVNLKDLARQAMLARRLDPDSNQAVQNELDKIQAPAQPDPNSSIKDRRNTLWFSLDNDDSKDLDQLTYAEKFKDYYKICIAIADVDALVKKDSPIDRHAQQNTTSVYTPSKVFCFFMISSV
jgi:exoribonuclease-2